MIDIQKALPNKFGTDRYPDINEKTIFTDSIFTHSSRLHAN